jgi:hypothetical protein
MLSHLLQDWFIRYVDVVSDDIIWCVCGEGSEVDEN